MEIRVWLIYLWCTLVGHWSTTDGVSALHNWTPVSVDRSLSVTRGGQVDLGAAITFRDDIVTSGCSVQYVAASDTCGRVQPTRFSCSERSRPILYQHSGCLSEREFVTFLISSRTETSANVSTFSVEIIIEPVQSPTAGITLELLHSDTLLGDGQPHNLYRIKFPSELIGKCHYEVVVDWQPLSLPISGTLDGVTNQPLPCGFMDNTSGLMYVPNNSSTPPDEDYLLIKVHSHDKSVRNQFVVLHMRIGQSENSSHGTVRVLPTRSLVVRQGANTLIPLSLLTFQNSSHSLHLGDSQLLYRYTFPIFDAGSFQSILSSSVNMSHTTFTNRDLLEGNVAFYTSFLAPEQTTFHYTISNVAGSVVAIGNVDVFVERHQWDWPVQRTNRPLEVLEGGSNGFDQTTLDFYLQPTNLCMQQASMTAIILPKHGHLTFPNGSDVGSTSVLISTLRNDSTLLYNHTTSGGGSFSDSIVWEISCQGGPVFEVFTSVLIAPVSDLPAVLLRGWDITVHRGWSMPISPSSLLVVDFDSPPNDVIVTVEAGLVTLDLKALDIDYPPYVKADRLQSKTITHKVTTFSMSDLENYNVWYVPPANTSVINEVLTFTVGESTATVKVDIVDLDLNQTLYLTTHEEYPSVPHNIALPLHTTDSTYITSAYLYSKAAPYPSEKLVYMVTSPPGRGLLCLLSGEKCQTSISRFTQRDINSQHVYYMPDKADTLKEDLFEFELTMDGFHQLSPALHRFEVKPVKSEVSVNMTRIFFVKAGRSKTITAKRFRPFTQYLQTRNVVFQVTRSPHYGRLELKGELNPTNFTFQDVWERSLVYKHCLSAMKVYSDQFSFSVGNSTHSLDSTMRIAIRHGDENVHVQVDVQQHTLFADHKRFVFSREDINVTSSFGLDFVTFTLNSLPVYGVLNLYNNKLNTIIQLKVNSTFTARDIYNGFLHYVFTNTALVMDQMNDTFNLTAEDPESKWPLPEPRRPETTGHFPISIRPTEDVIYELIISVTSPGILTWLPDHQQYGYQLSQKDIVVLTSNFTIEPDQVVIQLDVPLPNFGSIWKNDYIDNIFTIEDVHSGRVRYQSSVIPNDLYSDRFHMDIYINLMNFLGHRNNITFGITWATVSLQNSSLTVRENDGRVEVVVRRSGALWFESQVVVSTKAESAESNTGGRRPPDFGNMTQRIIFPINVTEQTIVITIEDDDIAEDTETFLVELSDPRDVVIGSQNRTKIWIDDIDDYSMITAMGGISPTSECTYVTRVDEGARKANITLRRSGNLGERVGVVCYTVQQPQLATATEWLDYNPRRRDQSNSTVWFDINQETAVCAIDILDDLKAEYTERFFVKLDQETFGRAVVRDPSEVHCVEINNERSDWPVVNFTTSKLVVQESNISDVPVPIMIMRTGPDLNVETTLRLFPLLMDDDNAVAGEDFTFPENERCSEGNSLLSCGVFRSGQSMMILHVIIKHDNVLEPNKSFHLRLESQPKGLEMVILDASPPAVVGFVNAINHVEEATGLTSERPEITGLNEIPITRSGYLNSSVTVTCKLKGAPDFGNATAGYTINDEGMDFLSPPSPTSVDFRPGETNKSCLIVIADDSVWEGPESLKVELGIRKGAPGTLGVEILEEASSAQVIIDDREDIPTMQFRDRHTEAVEPLSNFDIDRTVVTLTLVRSGDLSYATSVMYGISTYSSTQTFSDVNREVVFSHNEVQTNITIDLKANYDSDDDQQVTVSLIHGSERVLDTDNVPAKIGENATTVIVIINNRGSRGPFFPSLPSLENEGAVEIRGAQARYYDQPLLCITPCSSQYVASDESFSQDCITQNISQESTVYSWEISEDGDNFTTLNHSTPLTNTHSERLDTFYLKRDIYVRCSAQAVTHGGVRGHTRTSEVLRLGFKKYLCNGSGGGRMELTSYPGFIGHDKDLLRLSIRVPHRPNSIPLLSTHPIVNRTTNHGMDAPFCSTLIPGKGTGWLKDEPFYNHLDREQCEWEFTKWLPVEDWISRCGGVRSNLFDSIVNYINISVYIAYEQYALSLVQTSTCSARIEYIRQQESTPFLPPPLLTLPASNERTDAFIYPVAVNGSSSVVYVYFYSILPLGTSTNSSHLSLLHMDGTPNGSKQAWRLELDQTLPSTIPVEFQLPTCEIECDATNDMLTFSLSLSRDNDPPSHSQEQYRPALRANISIRHSPVEVNNYTKPFTLGDWVYVVFEWDPASVIQEGFNFSVRELSLCQVTTMMRECSDQYQIVTTMGVAQDTGDFDVQLALNEHAAVLQFNTSIINVEHLSSQWHLHLSYGISNGHEFVVKEDAILNISITDPSRHTTTASQNTESATAAPSKQILYVAVGMLVIALVVTTAGFTVIGLFVWTSKVGQQKFKSRLEAERVARSRRNSSRKNSLSLNNKKRDSSQAEDEEQSLRRSQSTTGFPTREKLRRVQRKKSSPPTVRTRAARNERQNVGTSEVGASARPVTISDEGASVQPSSVQLPVAGVHSGVVRARSLPNLAILETRPNGGFFVGEPQPRKLHFQTTVSKVNTERWHLNKWAQHHIKAHKQLEVARTIHDLATRRRNYGANESKQNTSVKEESHSTELARYAERSLAASAKTPEPEKGPRTKL